MNTDSKNFRVGVFVLIGLAMILAFTLVLGGQDLFDEPILAETFFTESVQGVDIGSAVKFRGVKLGAVSEIGLVADNYRFASSEDRVRYGQAVMVRIELYRAEDGRAGVDSSRLRDTLEMLIDQGMRLRLTKLGLTGASYVEADILDPHTYPPPELAWTPRDLYIPSARSAIQSISSSAERFMEKLERAQVDQVIVDLDEVLVSLDAKLSDLDVVTLQDAVHGLIDELRVTNGRLDDALTSLDVPGLGRDLGQALKRADSILGQADQALAGSRGDLADTLDRLRAAAASLADLAERARSHPSGVLFGDLPPPVLESHP